MHLILNKSNHSNRYTRLTLNNGMRLVYEQIPYLRSASVGIWVKSGSRYENEINNGVSHFIEHMMFKGTDKMNAREIAQSIENIGGQMNAFTGKECTCYYAKTLDEHLGLALEVLADIFFHSKYAEGDILKERSVIMEEIDMYEDSPDALANDMLTTLVWKNSTLGLPVLGTKSTLANCTRESMLEYISHNYTPKNTVVAVAGNFDEAFLLNKVTELFGEWTAIGQTEIEQHTVEYKSKGFVTAVKSIEQVHACIGLEGFEQEDERLYALLAVNNIFGGNMGSRLFQKIREELGLAYSIFSYPSAYMGNGLFTIYAGMNPKKVKTVFKHVLSEIKDIKKNKLSSEEFEHAKEQLKGSYILGLESTGSRMNSLGKSELLLNYIRTPDEILEKIETIDMDMASDVIDSIFDTEKISIALVGMVDEKTKEAIKTKIN